MCPHSQPSSEDRERQLKEEIAEVRARLAALDQEVIDLRASAVLWRRLYDDAMRRLTEGDAKGKGKT